MVKAVQIVTPSPSRGLPFDKLVLSQSNVRRIKAGVSVEELAEDIARRGLLQSLNVRPVLDPDGIETDMFEIPAGGRRFQALSLLVKQKRLAKTAPIPCIVRDAASEIVAEDDSLAENMQRVALHQFRALVALREKGQGEEAIAAAFTVNLDHTRQVQVWDAVKNSWNKEPYAIRRMLTETSVRAPNRRAVFVGVGAYEAARVDSDEPNAPGDVSQSSGLRGPVARGMVPRLQDRSQTDVPQRRSRLRRRPRR